MLMYVYPLRGGAAVQNSRKFVWFKIFRLPFFCCLESIVLYVCCYRPSWLTNLVTLTVASSRIRIALWAWDGC
jgi:hypothetical protein